MKAFSAILLLVALVALPQSDVFAQTYAGTQQCQGCHSVPGRTQYTQWSQTLHSKIHLVPDNVSIRPLTDFTNGLQVSMGSSYANAKVIISKVGAEFFIKVGETGTTYKVAYTYGWGWKQRYLVKIEESYYMPPIQYNFDYLDASTGTWATYNPQNWFNADGTVKPLNNTFRTKSWDKNCMGCHVTGGRTDMLVVGADTSWKATWAGTSSPINMVVGCEDCHGPSSTHFGGTTGTMNPSKLTSKKAKIEVCGQCHNRASSWRGAGLVGTHEFPKNELNNTYFNPADTTKPISSFLNLATPPNATGGFGAWPDLVNPRQHHQQYHDMIGSKHYTTTSMEITCFTCHTAHRVTPNKHNVIDSLTVGATRFKVNSEDNTLCLSCHATLAPFASIQKSWVSNEPAFRDSIGRYVKLHTKHTTYDPLNLNSSGGNGRCVTCHMTKTAVTAKSYDISTHTFAVIPPVRTIQFQGVASPTNGMLNSCAYNCHRNPSGPSANVPSFGVGTDATLTDWRQSTDISLANILWAAWQGWGFSGVKEVEGTTPLAFSLSQNYPNPFNPSTKILVDLSKQSNIRLTIYNVIGQEVARLMDGHYGAGKYEVTWSGKDNEGLQAPSGVYLYKLDAGDQSFTKKMLMVK